MTSITKEYLKDLIDNLSDNRINDLIKIIETEFKQKIYISQEEKKLIIILNADTFIENLVYIEKSLGTIVYDQWMVSYHNKSIIRIDLKQECPSSMANYIGLPLSNNYNLETTTSHYFEAIYNNLIKVLSIEFNVVPISWRLAKIIYSSSQNS